MPIMTFTAGHPPYNAGERASFTDDEAAALMAAGVVVADNDNTPADAPQKAAADAEQPAPPAPAPPAAPAGDTPPADPGTDPAEQPEEPQA